MAARVQAAAYLFKLQRHQGYTHCSRIPLQGATIKVIRQKSSANVRVEGESRLCPGWLGQGVPAYPRRT